MKKGDKRGIFFTLYTINKLSRFSNQCVINSVVED